MKKIITRRACPNLHTKEEKVVVPSNQTIDFLKLYARSYYAHKTMPKAFNSICIN